MHQLDPRASGAWRAIARHVHAHRDIWAIVLFCLLSFVAYGRSLGGFFLADDFALLAEFHDNLQAALREFVRKAESWETGRKYRPIWFLSFFVDGLAWGTNPFGFRLTNLLLHVGCAWFLYRFCAKVTQNLRYALVTGAVFCCFPANYEGVMWVSARGDLLCLLFQLVTLSMFLTSSGELALTRTRWWAAVPAALALLSKEAAIALPPTLLVLTWLGGRSKGWRAVWDAVAVCAPVLVVFVAYFTARHVLLGALGSTWSVLPWPGLFEFLGERYALVRLLVAPVRVTAHSELLFHVVEALSLLILLLGAFASVIRSRGSRDWLIFCIVWFLLTQGPLVFLYTDPRTQTDVRFAYVPSAAYSALLTHSVFSLLAWARAGTPRMATVVVSVMVALLLYLLVGNQESYIRSGQMTREVHDRALAMIQENPKQPKVFIDLPTRFENALCCLNAGHYMFQPPFIGQPSLAAGFSDSTPDYDALVNVFRNQLKGHKVDYYRFHVDSMNFVPCVPPKFVVRTGTATLSPLDGEHRLDNTRLLLVTDPGPGYLGQRLRVEALLVDSSRGPLLVAFKVDRL